MSKFWCESGVSTEKPVEAFTHLLIPEFNSDGSVSMEIKILEQVNSPLDLLSFDDFTLEKCLKNGVSYKALQISDDFRMGHDKEIDDFNAKLESINNKLFNEPKSE